MMHTTNTIDYVVVLKGEVTLLLDDGEVRLKPFDAVLQRSTNHYWINEGNEPVLMLGVLLVAKN
ncbi:cupin domain-containing protein [Legionella gresilensis]|uniref:cupin domain-containing protein n=1 Tax=Legionella gresilensis TaxID=91823 RepID=UPI0010414880|nr:cupin domain-containing protein [Legionella gresilensis]